MPAELATSNPAAWERFDELLVYGEGPLPAPLDGWMEVQHSAKWRRLMRPGFTAR